MALYFASQGKGHIRCRLDADPEPYVSPSRVLLNGLGSDELLGGYGRHRTVFDQGGWPAIIDEV
jgi:asparagine synthetase B (glutamine-hydrolysing)